MVRVFLPPSVRHFRPRFRVQGPTSDYVCLEYDLVAAVRPFLLADVGAGAAMSFFTYCQSVVEHELDTTCYGIENWSNEGGADSPFGKINAHARQHYLGHAYLPRMVHSESLMHFDRDSVDLLRIDGTRPGTYGREGLVPWFERLRPGGVLGVYGAALEKSDPLWQRVAELGPSIRLSRGQGFGLVRKPGGPKAESGLLWHAFEERDEAGLEQFYEHAQEHLRLLLVTESVRFGVADEFKRKKAAP